MLVLIVFFLMVDGVMVEKMIFVLGSPILSEIFGTFKSVLFS